MRNASGPANSPVVLIVDDDAQFASFLGEVLERNGYSVICAGSEQQALGVLESLRDKIALVIVDLVLENESGFQLIGALRRRPNQIKIIAVSGIFRESELYLAHRVGADATLRKPRGESLAMVNEWLPTITNLVPPTAGAPATGG